MTSQSSTGTHWDDVYSHKAEDAHSWFQATPVTSLELVEKYAPAIEGPFIDIGAGASRLVDELLARDYADITLLDISEQALETLRRRLGERAGDVTMIAADITGWRPSRAYAVWHDRAVLHFLTERQDQDAYNDALVAGTIAGSKVIISTFAPEGPERCSGLPVQRYSAASLSAQLGAPFALLESRKEGHVTPGGQTQVFTVAAFERLREPSA